MTWIQRFVFNFGFAVLLPGEPSPVAPSAKDFIQTPNHLIKMSLSNVYEVTFQTRFLLQETQLRRSAFHVFQLQSYLSEMTFLLWFYVLVCCIKRQIEKQGVEMKYNVKTKGTFWAKLCFGVFPGETGCADVRYFWWRCSCCSRHGRQGGGGWMREGPARTFQRAGSYVTFNEFK